MLLTCSLPSYIPFLFSFQSADHTPPVHVVVHRHPPIFKVFSREDVFHSSPFLSLPIHSALPFPSRSVLLLSSINFTFTFLCIFELVTRSMAWHFASSPPRSFHLTNLYLEVWVEA